MIRPSHAWPVLGLTAVVWLLSAVVRGDEKPTPKADPEPKPVALPLTRITLFTAGVGYFHREGAIEGEARTELRFPEADVNDLIKSLILTDSGGGKVKAVTYDNRAPVDFTLKSFSIDLTENPTIGQLLHQVRGETISASDKLGTVLTGQIVSVERPPATTAADNPGEQLNLLTPDGLQSVELRQTKKIQFAKPELQAEFRKALQILAASRGDGKKTVAVAFAGKGKRQVGVGYVVEAPIWKASYRLALDDKGATRLQGWATVENTSDEDWNNVKVGLVAGRPLSFQMDLYDPLFVPRPQVEPDLFASLRTPMYQGGMNTVNPAGIIGNVGNQGVGIGGFGGGIGGFGGGVRAGNFQSGAGLVIDGTPAGMIGQGANFLGIQGGQFGNQLGIQGGNNFNAYQSRTPRPNVRDLYGTRLAYQEYLSRLQNKDAPSQQAEGAPTVRDPLDPKGGVLAAAEAGRLGDTFQYKIEEPVTLPRMKSALLPIVNEAVEGNRVSIFNEKVLAKHPLLGVKLVNKTKLHLAQGPVTVYEGDTFAGDARLPDLKPGETRLVSFAIDLGTEVVSTNKGDEDNGERLLKLRVADGFLKRTTLGRKTTHYLVRNRDTKDRTVLIEYPITEGWKLVSPLRAVERSRNFYRFEVATKAGEAVKVDVIEEREGTYEELLANMIYGSLDLYGKQVVASAAVRAVLARVRELRDAVTHTTKELEAETATLKEIGEDQSRIRQNIDRVPRDSAAYKRYLQKFDDQETEIEKRQARSKELKAGLAIAEKALKDYVASARAE